jgi:hypothetical protein
MDPPASAVVGNRFRPPVVHPPMAHPPRAAHLVGGGSLSPHGLSDPSLQEVGWSRGGGQLRPDREARLIDVLIGR